jgi:hypothetical protein
MSTYPEPLVARSLGVKKNRLAETRKARLSRGADWALVGAVVAYTPAGLKKLCGVLGLDWALVPVPTAAAVQAATSEPEPQIEALRGRSEAIESHGDIGGASHEVTTQSTPDRSEPTAPACAVVAETCEQLAEKSRPVLIEVTGVPQNTIIIHGRLEGKAVTVRVKSNANFIPGLWIQATPINGGTYYSQVGNPPRWKGDRHGFTKPQPPTP